MPTPFLSGWNHINVKVPKRRNHGSQKSANRFLMPEKLCGIGNPDLEILKFCKELPWNYISLNCQNLSNNSIQYFKTDVPAPWKFHIFEY